MSQEFYVFAQKFSPVFGNLTDNFITYAEMDTLTNLCPMLYHKVEWRRFHGDN